MHLTGLRGVLDDLDEVVAEDDLAGGCGHVLAEGERLAIDLERQALPVHDVLDGVLRAAEQARATGVERAHEHTRVDEEVRRGERVEHQVREPGGPCRPARGRPSRRRRVLDVLAGGEIALQQREVGRVLLPGGIGEPAVLRIQRHRGLRIGGVPHARRRRRNVRQAGRVLRGRAGHGPRILHCTAGDGCDGRSPPIGSREEVSFFCRWLSTEQLQNWVNGPEPMLTPPTEARTLPPGTCYLHVRRRRDEIGLTSAAA